MGEEKKRTEKGEFLCHGDTIPLFWNGIPGRKDNRKTRWGCFWKVKRLQAAEEWEEQR